MARKKTLPEDHLVVTSRHGLGTVKKLDAIAAAMTQRGLERVTRTDLVRLAVERLIKEMDRCGTMQPSSVA